MANPRCRIDRTEIVYGMLTAVRLVSEEDNKALVWECRCQCGTLINKTSRELSMPGLRHGCKKCKALIPKKGTRKAKCKPSALIDVFLRSPLKS